MIRPRYLRLGLAASGWLALAATALPAGTPPRVIISFVFLLVCPGAAATRLGDAALRRSRQRLGRLELFVLTIALSLSIGALVAEAFLLTHSFSPTRTLVVLAAFTSIAALYPVGKVRLMRASWNDALSRIFLTKEPH
ncbi:MAG TPA: hypothetical protein VGZ32_22995 [Actinocrinis sp.]|jgi:uncharacterized membrane protein|uniref:hypothetical protein n=1 Tax=Actinocrinis sp. TaxID=1920516 RepID=UPI002DDD2BFC|nr:hypothetical protein [Actinocrinis sp.]HEV3173233.1 hypothetical protein [Actinocrinis sp.]